MEVMIENNERILDMMNNGQLYNYKERTQQEIQALNAQKRNKQLIKIQGGGVPNVTGMATGQTQQMIYGAQYQYKQGKS